MLRLPIRRTRQFALLTALICVLVAVLAACLLYLLIRSDVLGVPSWLPIAAVGIVSVTAAALLITVLFAYALRQLISELSHIVFPNTEGIEMFVQEVMPRLSASK